MKELLLTGLVLVAALLYVRHKAGRDQAFRQAPSNRKPPAPNRLPMVIAGLLVVLTLGISGVVYYLNWQAAHQRYLVQVTNTHTGEVLEYHVYRDDIRGRHFQTIDGRVIHLSDMERMEVSRHD